MGNKENKEYDVITYIFPLFIQSDPYIIASQQPNNRLNQMYSQSSVLPSFADSPASIQTLSQQQKTTVTQAIRNPIKIDRNSMTLENDACYRNKWYIKFKYTLKFPQDKGFPFYF